MKRGFIRETVIIGILALIIVLAGLSQTIVYRLDTPPGFVYPLVHNYVEDYYYYLHIMRQGYDGMWLATSRLTPEQFPPQFINPFFLFLGHAARIFRFSLPVTYTLARGFGSIVLIGLTYFLIRRVFPDSLIRRVLTLLAVFSGSYFWIFKDGHSDVPPLVHSWTELDPLFRLSYIPHHLWSKVFMLAVLLAMLKTLRSHNTRYIVVSAVLVVIMGFISPVVLATFVPLVCIWFVLLFIAEKKNVFRTTELTLFLSVILSAVGVAVYHRIVQNGVFPWTSYIWWEKVQYAVTEKNYLQSLGPDFVLFLFSVPVFFKMRHLGSLLIAWVVTGWVTLFVLAPYIPLTNSRYLGGYQFIPLGIGASLSLFTLADYLYKRFNILTHYNILILFGILFFYNTIGLLTSWNEHKGYIMQNKNNIQVYVPLDLWQAFGYLSKQDGGHVVVAPLDISTMIPAFTSDRTISGHKTITYEYDKKNQELAAFYGSEDNTAAKEFLNRYNAKYILNLGQETADTGYEALGLTKVYNTPSVRIYLRP